MYLNISFYRVDIKSNLFFFALRIEPYGFSKTNTELNMLNVNVNGEK